MIPTRKELDDRKTRSGLIPPKTAAQNDSIKIVVPEDPEPEPIQEITEEFIEPESAVVPKPEPRLNETDLERRVSKLQARLNEFENEIAEFRSVRISRRGPAGPIGVTGVRGKDGRDGVDGKDSTVPGPKGDSIIGPPGPRGFPGRDSTVPGPKGDQGNPGSVEEATAAANKFVEIEMQKFQGTLGDMIRQALRDCGATDEFGKAVLIPGPVGPTGAPGRDGKDSTIPGPIGPVGAPGRDGKDSTIPGPPGRDGKDSTIPGPRGEVGPRGPAGKDSTVPGPVGRDGRDGIDGIDGREGIPGPAGKVGNIDVAVHNAEKAALALVQKELEKFKDEFLKRDKI